MLFRSDVDLDRGEGEKGEGRRRRSREGRGRGRRQSVLGLGRRGECLVDRWIGWTDGWIYRWTDV